MRETCSTAPRARGRPAAVLLALALLAGCEAEPVGQGASVHGPWRWVGSFGGIAGIRPTPGDEGYDRIFYFHRDGRLSIFGGDSLRIRTGYRLMPFRAQDGARPEPGMRYADPLVVFPFDPGVRRHAVRRAGPDTLILADPCCFRYEHAFVRVE